MSEPFLGQIQTVGFNFPPRGWALCDGQTLPIAQNTALFSLLGTTFGGDGRTTFGLPELRGRYCRHVGSGPGLDHVSWGEKSGHYEVTLTTQTIPSHNHGATGLHMVGSADDANTTDAENAAPATTPGNAYHTVADTNMAAGTVGGNTANTGGGLPFNSLNPFLGIYTCIALVGLYPSRS